MAGMMTMRFALLLLLISASMILNRGAGIPALGLWGAIEILPVLQKPQPRQR